jgi:hypothetical protein
VEARLFAVLAIVLWNHQVSCRRWSLKRSLCWDCAQIENQTRALAANCK